MQRAGVRDHLKGVRLGRVVPWSTVVAALLLLAQPGWAAQPDLLAQIGGGGTSTSNAVRQIERSVTRPLPAVPPTSGDRSADVWVPDRVVPDPMRGGNIVIVPGHWERRLSTGEHYAPSTVACTATGECATTPAGVRPAPDTRVGP